MDNPHDVSLSTAMEIIASLEAENKRLKMELACHRSCQDSLVLEDIRKAYIEQRGAKTRPDATGEQA